MSVLVVNMIPNYMSNETNRDSEPNLAVNPANPLQIAASAFTPDPMASGSGPIFVSTDGGNTWILNIVLPGGNRTVDITLRFAGSSNVLYAGIMRLDNSDMNILRKNNFTAPGLMTVLVDRANEDQPYVEAATVLGGGGVGLDRVYVGNNDFNTAPTTATVDVSLDAATAPPPAGFNPDLIETRSTGGQDGPSIRPAIHPDGTVYAADFRWITLGATTNTADVVVRRDDNWASGPTPFTALINTGDGQPGVPAASGVSIPSLSTMLGTQRIGSHLAIAVDPTNSRTVYVAWADGTSGSNYTIRVRRSTDGGTTWSGDLRAITQAVNPGLAINAQGTAGFLYQKLVNPGSGNRWQTHLEISSDGFMSSPTDLILADVPDSNGSYTGINPIGDYACLRAVNKDFYGVFSANNTPDLANFPNGVTYQRNADWVSHVLKDLSNNPVPASIDPFFFKVTGVAAADDFYVRDWTDNPTSGDTGLEPSTHAVFYATSDVWNRRGTLVGPFPNDQPSNEDAGNGAGNLGDNWAFARIRRNAPAASGSKTVTAHFLVSKFGTGSNYVDAGSADPDVAFPDPDPTVTFNATDVGPFITPAYHWHLNGISSIHLCLAVEISAPGDPYVPPSLVGNTPGWPVTDLRIINDNDKAQRNMGLSTTPARGAGMSDSFYAIIHNAATFPRDMVVRYEAEPSVQKRLQGAAIEVIDGRSKHFKSGDSITLKNMQPGENRWIGLTFNPPQGEDGEILPVNFYELAGSTVVNGFAIGARPSPMNRVIHNNLELHRSVFTRMAAGFRIAGAEEEGKAAQKLLEQKSVSEKTYLEFLRSHFQSINRSVSNLIKSQRAGDPFGAAKAVKTLGAAIQSEAVENAAVAHTALLNKLDSFLTMRQLSQGDTADILQNVRWQKDLYVRVPQLVQLGCSGALREQSEKFITAYGERKAGNRDFPELIRNLLECFRETAQALTDNKLGLEEDIAEMERNLSDPTPLQKAHRAYLLKLQSLEKET